MNDTPEQYFPQPLRSEIGTIAMAAWLNVPVDKVPLSFKSWTCPQSRAAWERVEKAIRADLPATPAQIAASPEVRALVEIVKRAKTINDPVWPMSTYVWQRDAEAALAAFKAMEAGE